jgi:hypothetical protein
MSLAGIVIHKEGMVKPQRFTILPLAVQGFGNVGSAVAIFFAQAGATIISVSDSQGGIYNENGIDLEEARAHKLEHGLLSGLHESTSITNQELLELDCEILIPACPVAGSRPVEILIGKSFPGMLVGLVEGSFILMMAVIWFEVPLRGSLGALYIGMFLFILSGVGIGLMISSLAVTQQQGMLGAFLFMVPAIILSGFATPIANMPTVVQWITYADPLRYFLIILRGVFLEGDDASMLLHYYWPMAIIAVVTLSFAGWLFRHRMS